MASRSRKAHLSFHPEGVKSPSPGSRSAPWVGGGSARIFNPEGVGCDPFGVENQKGGILPRVRCATLGFGMRPLRGRFLDVTLKFSQAIRVTAGHYIGRT